MRNKTPITGKAALRETRRLHAARLFERGELTQSQIARQLKVSRQSVSLWHASWKRGGAKALAARGPLGRPFRLTARQLETLKQALLAGAEAAGFSGELWTIERVRALIQRRFGVRYGHSGAWKLLGNLGFTSQRPARVAAERNPAGARNCRRLDRLRRRIRNQRAGPDPGDMGAARPDPGPEPALQLAQSVDHSAARLSGRWQRMPAAVQVRSGRIRL